MNAGWSEAQVFLDLQRWVRTHHKTRITNAHTSAGQPHVKLEWMVNGAPHALEATGESHTDALRQLLQSPAVWE